MNKNKNIYTCKLPSYNPNARTKIQKINCKNVLDIEDFISPNVRNVQLKNYADQVKRDDVTETECESVEIECESENRLVVVKKTSLVWFLRKDCQKLSSDRLLRVQNPHYKNGHQGKRKKLKKTNVHQCKPMIKMKKK